MPHSPTAIFRNRKRLRLWEFLRNEAILIDVSYVNLVFDYWAVGLLGTSLSNYLALLNIGKAMYPYAYRTIGLSDYPFANDSHSSNLRYSGVGSIMMLRVHRSTDQLCFLSNALFPMVLDKSIIDF